ITNISSTVASGSVTLTRDDGTPFVLNWVNDAGKPVANGNVIPFQLGPGESRKFVTVADTALSTGYATVTSTSAVMGTAVFTNFNSDGQMIGEAGVPPAIPLGKQALFVDTENGFDTGMAIANPNNLPLNITFQLIDTTGQLIGVAHR